MEALIRIDNILGDDKSWVELQDMMPHPYNEMGYGTETIADMAVVQAARVSMLGESKGYEADRKLLFYLLKHRHTTPFEQVEFKFRIQAPVVVWWQWTRHRTWHYNFQSGRYTEFEEDGIYIPTEWRLQSTDNKQGSDGVLADWSGSSLTEKLKITALDGYRNYKAALEAGVAKEQARFFLPAWCSYYVAVLKVDAWNLMNFIRLRSDSHAQYEIHQYSDVLFKILEMYMPWTAQAMRENEMIDS